MERILIIDDEQQIRSMLRLMLEREGYEVVEAPDGIEGIKAYRQKPADLIITDLIMLEMDGVEFCRKIRETDNKTFIIALTGHTALYDIDRLKEVGFDNHLTKPFKIEVIKQAIQEGFEEFRRRSEIQEDDL